MLMLVSGQVRAQPGSGAAGSSPAVALAWTGPGPELTCLGEDGLVQAVNEYLGRQAFASGSVELVLHVNVERLPDRMWRAVLELRDRGGTALGSRELASSTDLCSSLNEPLVLAVALMVEGEPEPEPEPAPVEVAPEPEPDRPEPPPALRPQPATSHWALSGNVAVAVEAGLLPAVRPGLELGLELRAASWLSARVSGVGFVPASADLEGRASVRIGLLAGAIALCAGFEPASGVHVALCAGPLYGALFATSSGLEGGRSTQRRLLAGMGGLRVATALAGRWALALEGRGVVPYRPDRFTYEHEGTKREVFQVSELALLAAAGLGVTF
jgi:hypothetical protein